MTFTSLAPVTQALLATLFTWGLTALGASGVFLTRQVSKRLLDAMLGFAAGVMIAASFWSLLAPAIELSEEMGLPGWLPAAIGFLAGGLFLAAVDRLLPHLHLGEPIEHAEGLKTTWKRSVLLVTAITLHNFPEGLAVGSHSAVVAGMPAATGRRNRTGHPASGFRISRRDWQSRCPCDARACRGARAS